MGSIFPSQLDWRPDGPSSGLQPLSSVIYLGTVTAQVDSLLQVLRSISPQMWWIRAVGSPAKMNIFGEIRFVAYLKS